MTRCLINSLLLFFQVKRGGLTTGTTSGYTAQPHVHYAPAPGSIEKIQAVSNMMKNSNINFTYG
jgi:hypothetical protein